MSEKVCKFYYKKKYYSICITYTVKLIIKVKTKPDAIIINLCLGARWVIKN